MREYSNEAELLNELLGDNLENISKIEQELERSIDGAERDANSALAKYTLAKEERRNVLSRNLARSEVLLGEMQSLLNQVGITSREIRKVTEKTTKFSKEQCFLTRLVTELERLSSFISGLDLLEREFITFGFRNMTSSLLAAIQFSNHFSTSGLKWPLLIDTQRRLEVFKPKISEAVFGYFEKTLKRFSGNSPTEIMDLAHAAIILELLDEGRVNDLVIWYCDRQLKDFKAIRHEFSNLKSLQKRFQWLFRVLQNYSLEHASIFPREWKVEIALAADFCSITKRDIREMLHLAGDSVDLDVLQMSVHNTRVFEEQLHTRLNIKKTEPEAIGEIGVISLSNSFESHIYIFIDDHDKDIQRNIVKTLPVKLGASDIGEGHLLKSAPILFAKFKEVVDDIYSLSNRKPLLDMAIVIQKHLSTFLRFLTEQLHQLAMLAPSTAASKDIGRINTIQINLICSLLNTCDFCQKHIGILEEELLKIVHPQYTEAISFQSISYDFSVVLSTGLTRLHAFLISLLGPIWQVMSSVNWTTGQTHGDQSNYLTKMHKPLMDIFLSLSSSLAKEKHYSELVQRLAASLLKKFTDQITMIRPMSEACAEQLFIDLEGLRGMILASESSKPARAESLPLQPQLPELIKRESREAENLLKLISSPLEPASDLVKNYLMLFPSGSHAHFINFLEMRAISKNGMLPYLQEFDLLAPVIVPWSTSVPVSATGGNAEGTNLLLKNFKFLHLDSALKQIMTQGISKFYISNAVGPGGGAKDDKSPKSRQSNQSFSRSHSLSHLSDEDIPLGPTAP